MLVRFSYVDEFITEVERLSDKEFDRSNPVDLGKTLRRTNRIVADQQSPNINYIYVTSTIRYRDEIIRLDKYVGMVIGIGEDDEKVNQGKDEIYKLLDDMAERLGLETAAGMYDANSRG